MTLHSHRHGNLQCRLRDHFLLLRSTDSFKCLSLTYSLKSSAKNLKSTATTSTYFSASRRTLNNDLYDQNRCHANRWQFSVFLVSCHKREVYDPLGWKFSLTIKVFYCGRDCSFHIHSTRTLIAAHCTHFGSWSDRTAFEEFAYRHDTRPSCSNSSAAFPTKWQKLQKRILITSSHMGIRPPVMKDGDRSSYAIMSHPDINIMYYRNFITSLTSTLNCITLNWFHLTFQQAIMIFLRSILVRGVRGGAIGRSTALQAARSRIFIHGVIWIFHWLNPSGRTMALESTQPLTDLVPGMSVGGQGGQYVGLKTVPYSCTDYLESLNLLQPQRSVQACIGIACL
jgi:hypothetical protein